jgi:hypothetical protein
MFNRLLSAAAFLLKGAAALKAGIAPLEKCDIF